ncbi:MAG: DNA repair protein RadA [Pseudomonadota bacterium]
MHYECQSCGHLTQRWAGQCPGCSAWNTMVEQSGAAPRATGGGYAGAAGTAVVSAADVDVSADPGRPTGLGELDRVLGGGLVPGAVVLIGGDPGIGKSTLLLQALASLVTAGLAGIYVTGEESLAQVVQRADRLGLSREGLQLLAETEVERIVASARRDSPGVLIIDSVQTMHTEAVPSAPGGVAQVRESTAMLVRFAKSTGTSLFLVGHVTKEGALAGPRVLEHMVDTVLYFESESSSRFRLVRAIKNRYGAVNEIGIFAMTERGLKGVSNPSAIFLSRAGASPGSVVMVTREGTRPLLVELQALVDPTSLGNPRRLALGLDQNRMALLLAVLHRHGGIATQDQDVFVNVVGGVRISEPAADLPVVLAVLSSLKDRAIAADTVVFGELGLAGEVRPVPNGEERIREASKHGFKRALAPRANVPRKGPAGFEVVALDTLADALDAI